MKRKAWRQEPGGGDMSVAAESTYIVLCAGAMFGRCCALFQPKPRTLGVRNVVRLSTTQELVLVSAGNKAGTDAFTGISRSPPDLLNTHAVPSMIYVEILWIRCVPDNIAIVVSVMRSTC